MIWVVLVIVVILAAPTVANRLQALDPERQQAAEAARAQKKRGLLYRAVRRFGLRTVAVATLVVVAAVAVAAYLLIRSL